MSPISTKQSSAEELPTSARKNWMGMVLGLGISVLLLGGLAWSIEWESFLKELQKVNLLYIPLFLFVVYVSYWVRAIRWRYLLPQNLAPTNHALYDSVSVGCLATFVLPFRAGEFVRAYALGRWSGIPVGVSFASIVTERVFDVIVLLAIMGLSLMRLETVPAGITSGAMALGGVAGVIFCVMVGSYLASEKMVSLFSWATGKFIPDRYSAFQVKLNQLFADFIGGFKSIQSFRQLALVLLWTVVLWLIFSLFAYVTLLSFGEFPSFWVALGTNSMVALAVAVPSAPGFLGTFHFGCVLGLEKLYGYPHDFAVAYGVILHALNVVCVFALGFWTLRKTGSSLADLQRKD